MSVNQAILPMAGSIFPFRQHGPSGAWISDLLPHTAAMAGELCVVRSMYTEAINHDPAITLLQTGSQIAGRPSIGAWLSYGLGSDNVNRPEFVVLITKGKGDQPLYSRLCGAGFLPSRYQGVQLRAGRDPVLFLNNPAGVDRTSRRELLDELQALHELEKQASGDPEIDTRIAQYEMAFRMQASVPEVTDVSDEPEHVSKRYGPDVSTPGTFAANCLLARRLAERGVKFIQIYYQGWDQHGNLPQGIATQCRETDQPAAALVADLKNAACWTTRSCSGRASSAARTTRRASSRPPTTAATITPAASRSGWPAAASAAGWFTERRVRSGTTSRATGSTCATSMPPFCICWGSITSGLDSRSRASTRD
jgi:hypothetical protein